MLKPFSVHAQGDKPGQKGTARTPNTGLASGFFPEGFWARLRAAACCIFSVCVGGGCAAAGLAPAPFPPKNPLPEGLAWPPDEVSGTEPSD